MTNDQELPDDQLPPGQAPVWIEPPEEVTEVEMLERVEEIIGREYTDVIVQHDAEETRKREVRQTATWCKERGWQYHWAHRITGCEAKCVVLLNCSLKPEFITRGINMLILVTR